MSQPQCKAPFAVWLARCDVVCLHVCASWMFCDMLCMAALWAYTSQQAGSLQGFWYTGAVLDVEASWVTERPARSARVSGPPITNHHACQGAGSPRCNLPLAALRLQLAWQARPLQLPQGWVATSTCLAGLPAATSPAQPATCKHAKLHVAGRNLQHRGSCIWRACQGAGSPAATSPGLGCNFNLPGRPACCNFPSAACNLQTCKVASCSPQLAVLGKLGSCSGRACALAGPSDATSPALQVAACNLQLCMFASCRLRWGSCSRRACQAS
jgi:hypothetical protein